MTRSLTKVVFALIALSSFLASAYAEQRVALVVGNSAYKHVIPLPNPITDAKAIAASLKRLNFDVTLLTDQGSLSMRRALRDFARKSSRSDMAVIYFAGHGMEIDGRNFLIPTDAELKQDVDVEFETISLEDIMRSVRGAKGLRMVLLDACRNNPFAQSMLMSSNTRSIGRGLARVEPEVGTLVSYAAKQGTVAQDGDGQHSPYTKALLTHLEQPGLEVQFLFRKVRDSVLRDTNRRQEPFTYGSLPGKQIYLRAPQEVAPAQTQPSAAEVAYWNSVRTSSSPEVIRSYLKTYPQGHYVFLAQAVLKRIENEQARRKAERQDRERAEAEKLAAAEEARRRDNERANREAKQRAELEAALAAAREAEQKARLAAQAADKKRREQLRAWLAVQSSTDQAELRRYIAQYPGSPFIDLAVTRLESLTRQKLAALPPQQSAPDQASEASSTPQVLDSKELALAVQQQLARLGCNPGRPDGSWGARSRAALQRFAKHGKVRLAGLNPSQETLDQLQQRKGRVCPIICGRREVLKRGRCVAKTCGRGEELNRSGRCVKRKQERAKNSTTRNKPKTRASNEKKSNRSSSAKANQCGYCLPRTWTEPTRLCGAAYQYQKARGRC